MTQNHAPSLSAQLKTSLLAVTVLSLMITGGALGYYSFHSQLNQQYLVQSANSQTTAGKINSYIDDLQRHLNYLARIPGLTTFDTAVQNNLLQGLLNSNHAYEMVGLVDDQGQLLAGLSVSSEAVPQDWADTVAFRRAFREGEDFIGVVELTPGQEWPTLIMAVPIRDSQNKVDGMLFARVNLKFLWAILAETKMGNRGYVYVLDQRNFVIAHSGGMPDQFAFKDLSQSPVNDLFSSELGEHLEIYRGLYNTMVLGSAARTTPANWRVVIELPLIEAYAPVFNYLIIMGLGLAASVVVILILGTIISKRITLPLEQLTEAAGRFSRGEFETRVFISEKNELQTLGDTFNKMAQQLQVVIVDLKEEIAERKQAEIELIESRALQKEVFDSTSDMIWSVEPEEFRLLTFNHGLEEYYLKERGMQIKIGDRLEELLPTLEAAENWKNNYRQALQEGFLTMEYPVVAGTKILELNFHILKREDKAFGISVFGRDITERKQSEARIIHINRLYATISQINQAIVHAKDRKALFTDICTVAIEYGKFRMAWVGLVDEVDGYVKPFVFAGEEQGYLTNIKIAPQDPKLGNGPTGTAIREGRGIIIQDVANDSRMDPWREQVTRCGFGSSAAVPIRQKGHPIGALTVYASEAHAFSDDDQKLLDEISQDISYAIDSIDAEAERKRAEDEIRQMNASLEMRVQERTSELIHASRVKDEFLANMSHELRTPLNGILGLSESLLEGFRGSLNDKQQQSLETIYSSGEHLLGLINDILDVSKIEAGKLDLYPSHVSINDICVSSMNFIKQIAFKKSITVEYTRQPAAAMVYADPKRLKQILVNLLGNAVKFTGEQGSIKLEVQTNAKEGRIQFVVQDTGIGISADDLKRLFQPFVQLDNGLSRQHEGSGLGLVLVKKLIELHNGEIFVESEVGRGSTFIVSLPWSPGSENDDGNLSEVILQESVAETSLDKNKNIKILLAEDNQINVMVIQDYLEHYGYQVFVVNNGVEVLANVDRISPHLILMDIQMPELDGVETTRALRSMPGFASVPIIALTAFAMPGDRERCLAAGMNEYLSKPVKLKDLIRMVEEFVG